jgi:hypothetical protein
MTPAALPPTLRSNKAPLIRNSARLIKACWAVVGLGPMTETGQMHPFEKPRIRWMAPAHGIWVPKCEGHQAFTSEMGAIRYADYHDRPRLGQDRFSGPAAGQAVVRKSLRRAQMLPFLATDGLPCPGVPTRYLPGNASTGSFDPHQCCRLSYLLFAPGMGTSGKAILRPNWTTK